VADAEEKAWLNAEMQMEKQTVAQHRTFSVLQTMINWRVLALAAVHFGQAGVSVGLAVFVAQIIKGLGLTKHADRICHRHSLRGRDSRHDFVGPLLRQEE